MTAWTRREERRPEAPVIAGRVPPHDLDAEAAVLAALLLQGRNCLAEVADVLTAKDFYSESNGTIYQTILDVDGDDKPVDTVTVASLLRDRERLASVGGVGYLAQVVDATPAVANVRTHALIVHDKARLRRVIVECQTISAEGYADVGDVATWLDEAEARVCAVADEGLADDDAPELVGPIVTRLFTNFRDEQQGKVGNAIRLSTGLADLDGLLKGGGLAVGGVTATGAYWGVGKTSLALQIGVNVATSGHRGPPSVGANGEEPPGPLTGAAFFSLEMPKDELTERALCQMARVDAAKPKTLWNRDEWSAITAAAQTFHRAPLWIDDRAEQTPMSIRARLRRMKADAKRRGIEIRLVVIDYLQLINGKTGVGPRASREEEVGFIARNAKLLARSEKVHVIVVGQLNDDAQKRGAKDPRPRSADFRESKAIPMNADNCLLIHNPFARARALARRDGHGSTDAPDAEVVELILDKQRGGRTGTVRCLFEPSYTSFVSYDGRHYDEEQ